MPPSKFKDVLAFIDGCKSRGVRQFDGLGVRFELDAATMPRPVTQPHRMMDVDGLEIPADLLDHEAS